ncbi:MAG: prolipoprotein diacylglyceryl transferase [Nanoarchaeota archaeon]|nr:prolipoprotein diacylglyceryl transferase [Nanoarchaeota archaeon]
MFVHDINPVLFAIGPFEIRYYGIIYALGFVIAYFMLRYFVKTKRIRLTNKDIDDFIFYQVVGIVFGARLAYVLFYNLSYYITKPLEALAFWSGGLSFHGGLIGGGSAAWLFCRKKNIKFYKLVDLLVIPAALGLCLGRIGNFLNGELVGRVTDVPWAVKFKGYDGYRHPSQIYESIKNLIIFATLWVLKDKKIGDKKLPDGFLFWLFVIMYSMLRFIVEFWREPDSQLGFIFAGITMGQILSLATLCIGLVFMIRLKKNER